MIALLTDEEREFIEHVEELIYRLRIVFFTWLIATLVFGFAPTSWFQNPPEWVPTNYTPIVEAFIAQIKEDMLPEGVILYTGTWTAPIVLYFTAAAIIGLMFAAPVLAYEIYVYVRPAIYPQEKKYLIGFILAFIGLFALGAAIAYWVVLPATFQILLIFVYRAGASPLFSIDDFYGFVFFGIVTVGLVFTFPVVIALLTLSGAVDKEILVENRRNAIFLIFAATAIFTPDPTPFSMLILAVPLTALYEISVWVAGKLESKE